MLNCRSGHVNNFERLEPNMKATIQYPSGYVDLNYLDIADSAMRPIKHRSHDLMRCREGQTVLDMGCGIGLDTLRLAERVGPSGHVYGVDRDPDMIAEADRRARQAGICHRVSHHLCEAAKLPYPADFFDACRIERMLMHVLHPLDVLAEARRVLKVGGWLVLVEPDWGTLSIAVERNVEIERRLALIRAEKFLPNGYAGRRICQWMQHSRFPECSVEVSALLWRSFADAERLAAFNIVETFAQSEALISPTELQAWRSELQQLQEQGCFFASLNIVMAAGCKPLVL